MFKKYAKAFGPGTLLFLGAGAAFSQPTWEVCIDPMNTQPYSNDFGSYQMPVDPNADPIVGFTFGTSGTITYGGSMGPCFNPGNTANVAGSLGFKVGPLGSVQDSFDDNMVLTFGMPVSPARPWSHTEIVVDGTHTIFGQSGLAIRFVKNTARGIVIQTNITNVQAHLEVDVVGDATRVQWNLTNTDTAAAHALGLWFGQWCAMQSALPSATTGTPTSGFGGGKDLYIVLPGQRPLTTDRRFIRSQNPATFPQTASIYFGQSDPYGLKLENGPTDATGDVNGQNSDATQVDEIAFGSSGLPYGGYGPGLLAGESGDPFFSDDVQPQRLGIPDAYLQKYYPTPVSVGGSRQIVSYYRSTWGRSNYALPYAAVVDAPQLVATDPNDSNTLVNNPFTIRVWVDDFIGYAANDNTQIDLNNVRITLNLPQGLTLVSGSNVKTINFVPSRQMRFVDFQVQADGVEFGELPYEVLVNATPGGSKQITGIINVAATPRYRLQPQANLITAPWIFADSSWDVVLGLTSPNDFQAFDWDPVQLGYVISSSAARGKGTWIILNSGSTVENQYNGNPQQAPDTTTGAPLIQLKQGWNLIGNPYNYSFPLGQISGVSGGNQSNSFTWAELVQQGAVSGSLSYWDTNTQSYKFIDGLDDLIVPNRGYWIYSFDAAEVTLSVPPIFAPGLPGSFRSTQHKWTDTDKQWKLNLTARSPKSIDDQNYVGLVPNAKLANSLRHMEPPMGPTQDVGVSFEGTINGKTMPLAQSLSDKPGKQEWKMTVRNLQAGPVTVNWPNLNALPKNVRFTLVDLTTNTRRELRKASGYTYQAKDNEVRNFKVQIQPGTTARAMIGNVVVNPIAGRANGKSRPVVINYTLTAAGTTSIRILSGSGKVIYNVARGRADSSGENSATWMLQDNANRAVPPGTYRAEITVEDADGNRSQRTVPINVIR